MATIAEALGVALDHHRNGRLAEAEVLYRRILDADPEQPDALHLLGMLAAQCGQFDTAVELIGQAIGHRPRSADFHRHHAMALDRLGRVDEAAAAYAAAAELDPGHADTLFNLGILRERQGRPGEAEASYARALEAAPGHAAAANNRGLVLRALGRTEDAAASFARAGAASPGFAAAWYHLGLALAALDRADEAAGALRRAVCADPSLTAAHINLGNILQGQGEGTGGVGSGEGVLDRAAAHYRHALALDAGQAAAWRGLALTLQTRGAHAEAARAFAEAVRLGATDEPALWRALGTGRLASGDRAGAARAFAAWTLLDPGDPEAQFALGVAADRNGDVPAAEAAYRRAARIAGDDARPLTNLALLRLTRGRHADAVPALRALLTLRPDLAEPWYNLGIALRAVERPFEGIAAYRRALALRPGDGNAAYNMALDLQEVGRIEEAAAAYRRVLALDPGHVEAYCNLGSVVRASARYAEATAGYQRALALEPASVMAHRNLLSSILYDPGWTEEMRFAEHRRFEERLARPLYAGFRPHGNDPDPARRLRLGYVSSDFRNHPVGRNMEPILANHDHGRVEVFCYADIARPDEVTARYRRYADHWRDIAGMTDAAVAERIRADRIDVLIVLAGRFDNNRPLVAAHRPAPVQVSYHDGATSGLTVMDALLTDRVLTPRRGLERFTERPLRLPTLFAYFPLEDAPEPAPPPRQTSGAVTSGTVTFGSFNNPAKVSDAVLALWARVLKAVPESRLVLKYKALYSAPSLQARVRGIMAEAGLDPARVLTPAAMQERQHHLSLYRGVDIGLDPFPFCGATTTFEALYMGVPVVTLPGTNMMGRYSASLLTACGLPDLIAADEEDYVRLAARLAADPARLAELRGTLRPRILAAPFLNGRTKARHIERACRALWRRWCAAGTATAL